MLRQITLRLSFAMLLLLFGTFAHSQDSEPAVPATTAAPDETMREKAARAGDKMEHAAENVGDKASEMAADTRSKVTDIAHQVDQDPRAREATAGILRPIYLFAEHLSFPWFHWLAFTAMVTGVVSFAFQLVLGKLVVLSKMSISFSEILSDALGLAISAIGLVLTTQAAAENSTFTDSPASVLSATIVGAVAGLIFYRWGQAQEVQAAEARRLRTPAAP